MALDKQIHIYSVDTSAFYYCNEYGIHDRLNYIYSIRNIIKKKKNRLHKQLQKKYKKDKNYEDNMRKYEHLCILYRNHNRVIKIKKKKLYKIFNKNNKKDKIRELNQNCVTDKNIVSVFDSTLTRVTGMKINQLSDNLIIVQTYFFQILEDIILKGFTYNNEKYVVYTASAGQIRTKKTVFIKEKLLEKYENTLTCGLIDKVINERGTININKYLAYRALQNSATDEWAGFDMDKAIVVEDFETDVETEVDFINDKTYKIERKKMEVPIPHTDGAGIMLPSFCNKNRMCRSPWIKGLLGVFDFKKFIEKHIEKYPNCAKVKDIYGQEYDIIKDDIQVIFTKSQFKMWKFYNSWDEYKDNFKKYHCQVGYCNEEEDKIKNARINYQMLQTLVDMTDDELLKISKQTVHDIENVATDKKTMLKLIGAIPENEHKNNLQQSIQYYNTLLNDTYVKDILKQVRRSLVKKGKSGRLSLKAKYTFILPDLYAFSEWLFLKTQNPNGLLGKNEVSCNLYPNGMELDCLRSPHLFMEHCVRSNKVKKEQQEWFITKALYTSDKDIISKILQFDVDGDKSLVCSDQTIVSVAKRNIEKMDIVPLYYEMKKAGSMKVDKKTIYKGMISAYKGGNIGIYSNDISKIWNGENLNLKIIKILCMENNFVIDYAKTLYKPERPKEIKDEITSYTKKKVPYFFISAKDKNTQQVEKINKSVVNRLNKIIKTPRLDFKSIKERFSYKKLMHDSKLEIKKDDIAIINKYNELDVKSTFMIENSTNYKERIKELSSQYQQIREDVLKVNNDIVHVTDVLVKFLYNNKHDNKKITLWECFGDIILDNIKTNLTKDFKKEAIECENCGKLIEKTSGKIKYCEECSKEILQRQKNKWKREKWNNYNKEEK